MHLYSHELSNTPSPKGLPYDLKSLTSFKELPLKKAEENKE